MLHYFKFRQDLFDPRPAREVYRKPGKGKDADREQLPLLPADTKPAESKKPLDDK